MQHRKPEGQPAKKEKSDLDKLLERRGEKAVKSFADLEAVLGKYTTRWEGILGTFNLLKSAYKESENVINGKIQNPITKKVQLVLLNMEIEACINNRTAKGKKHEKTLENDPLLQHLTALKEVVDGLVAICGMEEDKSTGIFDLRASRVLAEKELEGIFQQEAKRTEELQDQVRGKQKIFLSDFSAAHMFMKPPTVTGTTNPTDATAQQDDEARNKDKTQGGEPHRGGVEGQRKNKG